MKPVVAITLGDPSGIGPEVCAGSLQAALATSRPVIFGHLPSLNRAMDTMSVKFPLRVISSPTQSAEGEICIVPTDGPVTPINEHDHHAAGTQFHALESAVTAVLEGSCDAIATGPVSKALISTVHPGFTGHTEYLAARSSLGKEDVTMVFAATGLSVALAATHVPMCRVPSTITEERYERTLFHLEELLLAMNPEVRPKIAVAALNPHGGEGGLLGSEEQDFLEPFCKRQSGENKATIEGPIPADTVFRDALGGKYDGVVAAYHDQAMIPLKLMGPGKTVNITMGLPFVRTSPDHGTAYDLAGTGKADPSGMIKAIEIATKLHASRNQP